jgi:hypothetical protein
MMSQLIFRFLDMCISGFERRNTEAEIFLDEKPTKSFYSIDQFNILASWNISLFET